MTTNSTASVPGDVDDRSRAAEVLARLRAGEQVIHRGTYKGARQLLEALSRRTAPRPGRFEGVPLAEAFHRGRAARLDEQRVLSRLLVEVGPGWRLALSGAPDLSLALAHAFGAFDDRRRLLSLREISGAVGAFGWYQRGVEIPALGGRIHPWYGVFAPTRVEVVELVASALGEVRGKRVFDVGTGTGVLGLVAARRGAGEVVATDVEPRAVECAAENAGRLGLAGQLRAERRSLFPDGRADVILSNPPWLPGKPRTALDAAVYDPDHRFLEGFLGQLAAHLAPGGHAILVRSDLAERLGLEPDGFLDGRIRAHGLSVAWARSAPATHPRARDDADPLHRARAAERIVLCRIEV